MSCVLRNLTQAVHTVKIDEIDSVSTDNDSHTQRTFFHCFGENRKLSAHSHDDEDICVQLSFNIANYRALMRSVPVCSIESLCILVEQ